MIDIYAIYTRHSSGTIKLQSIPAGSQDQIYLLNPTVKVEMGNAESMDFSVQAGTPYYDAFIQMRTFIRVDYDGTTIFYGRVLTIDNGAFGSRKIHCEGAISLLNDTQFPGKPEKERDEISIYEHMQEIIRNHNSQVDDGLKQFALGEVPGHYSGASTEQRIANESREFGSSSWADSKSLLEDLKSHYGGHFRARYAGGTIYLDWMNHYFRSTVNSQTIEVGKNLIDISGTTEVNNIFTAIIPVGKKENTKDGEDDKVYISYHGRNYLLIPEVCDFYSDGELNSGYHSASDYRNAISNYGMIFKTVDIQEGRTSDELLRLAAKWIKENYQGGVESFSVKAIDLRQIGENTDKILCGDRVRISYMTGSTDLAGHKATTVLTCTAVTYDLFNPENNQYSFGIPANSLGKNYGVKNKTKSTKDKSTTSSVQPADYGDASTPVDPNEQWRKAVFTELKKHKTWYKSSGNKETGPADRASTPNLQKIWHAHQTMTNGKTNYEVWIPRAPHYITGQSVYATRVRGWDRYSSGPDAGKPMGDWVVGTEEQLTVTYLKNHYLFEYMVDEHGVDLTTDLSVKMPGTYTDDEGNLELNGLTAVKDPVTGAVTRYTMATFGKFDATKGIMDYFSGIEFGNFDVESGLFNFLKEDGSGFISKQEDGDWHYYVIDPDDPTKLIEVTSTRDLHVRELHDDKRIGWVVHEDDEGNLSFENPGAMALQIEEYANGNLVVARVAGELTYLGNLKTQYIAETSLNHMDNICGDFEYETDQYGIKYVKINSGGGFRVRHGVLDDDGNFVRDPSGNILQADYGLYDNNTLKGGMIVEKINRDNKYTVKIKGDYVDIEAKQVKAGNSFVNLENWLTSQGIQIDEVEGLLAEKITAYEAHFHTIDTDYLSVNNLDTQLAKVSRLWLSRPNSTIDCGGYIYASGFVLGHDSSSSAPTNKYLHNAVTELKLVKINSYQYKLQKKNFIDNDWVDVEGANPFSGASLLKGSWSGGIFTVKFDPEGTPVPPNTIRTTALKLENKADDNPQRTGKSIKQVIKVRWFDSSIAPYTTNPYQDTGFEQDVTIDATLVYGYAWGEAFKKVDCPSTASTGTSLTIRYPGAASDSQSSRAYTFGNIDNNTVKLETIHHWNGSTPVYNTVAQFTHNQYYRATPASATIGSKVTGQQYNLSVKKNDGTYTALTVNASGPYADGQSYGESIGKAAGRPSSASLGDHGSGTIYVLAVTSNDGVQTTMNLNCKKPYDLGYDDGYLVTGISCDYIDARDQAAGSAVVLNYDKIDDFTISGSHNYYIRFKISTHGYTRYCYFDLRHT